MRTRHFLLASCFVLIGFVHAQAAPITFSAVGVAGVSGTVTFDDSAFDGTAFQFVGNTDVTALDITAFGQHFGLGDVAVSASTIFDTTGIIPRIVNGAGNLADNGVKSIAFFPDGFNGTAVDGDASFAFGASGALAGDAFYAVKWQVASQVPEPVSLLLLGSGLAAVGARRFRKSQA